MTPHSAYVWHCLHYTWHSIHPITTNHSIYDVTSTWGMTSLQLCQTSLQLYLCHHNLSNDITPNFYDITPTICVTSYAHYITSHPLLTSSHYCTYDSATSIYETTYSMQGTIYTIHVTSQPLVYVITPTVMRASYPLFVWHQTRDMYNIFHTIEYITSSLYDIKQQFLLHHTHYNYILSTLSLSSLPLYWWYHTNCICEIILYIWRQHIHCIQQHIHYISNITATVSVSHTHSFHDITPFVCTTLHPLYV